LPGAGLSANAMSRSLIETPRLLLRHWTDEDLSAFAAMNADPRVMEYLPKILDRTESDAFAARIRQLLDRRGYGLWAIEITGVARFAGFVGLHVPNFQAHFTPCVEIGWRLAYEHWGKGYATEAAKASAKYAFNDLQLDQIVSFTVPDNLRSRRVMERLNMTHSDAEDFDHPKLPEGHRLRRHVLYRLTRTNGGQAA
jgi:RimJ/RimL family protein N-acetyltransferase